VLLLGVLSSSSAGTSLSRPVTLVFVGDVMLGRDVALALDGDWAAAFAGVSQWLVDTDLAFANLESPLTDAPFSGGRFDLRAPPAAVAALQAAGFDAVSLANNHALDGGSAGLAETVDTLNQAGIIALPESDEPFVLGFWDIRVAVVAFLDTGLALDTSQVFQAADQADTVIVLIHWGAEYYPVTDRQCLLAQELAAAGADLIVGHGPHVLQPVEDVNGALVAYSLGNFLFDQPFPDTRQGAILRVTLARGRHGVRIAELEVLPTLIQDGRVWRAIGSTAATILSRLRIPSK
jgi:poly-gamma-glutamate synthesis protein (capsule biosynthesis protein)